MIIESSATRTLLSVLLLYFLVMSPAVSNNKEPLYGQWGTLKQCSAELIIEGGSRRATPFNISVDWLGHGEIWCRLRWMHVDSAPESIEATAVARCGEDSARDYHVDIVLANDLLTLTWDRWLVNGPLGRCKNR